jgi:putative membrane protein
MSSLPVETPSSRRFWREFGIRFLYGWGSNIVAIWIASLVFSGVDYGSFGILVLASLVFSLVNAVIRPIVVLLTLPVVILTLGVWLLFVNAFMLWITDVIVPSFEVSSFWTAVGAAFFIWIAHLALYLVLKPEFRRPRPPDRPEVIDL